MAFSRFRIFGKNGVGYDGEIRQARNLAQVAKDENITHFAQSSIAGCDNAKGVEHFESKWEIEKIVGSLGLPRTFIRIVVFMDSFLNKMLIPFLAGALKADLKLHMISVEDIGWFVAESFANPTAYMDRTIDIAGDSLTVAEIKRVYKLALGKNPTNFKFPFWAIKLLLPGVARQFQWNNDVGWHFDIQTVRESQPELMSFENSLKTHTQTSFQNGADRLSA
jgi:uncharacterized protein YbjT (DUF2867 family)